MGTSRFVTGTPGFQGVLKHRFTDFIVREIDSSGAPVVLRSLAEPARASDRSQVRPTRVTTRIQSQEGPLGRSFLASPELPPLSLLHSLQAPANFSSLTFEEMMGALVDAGEYSREQWTAGLAALRAELGDAAGMAVERFVELSPSDRGASLVLPGQVKDKEARTRAHQLVKKFFPMFVSEAIDDPAAGPSSPEQSASKPKVIQLKLVTPAERRRHDRWPSDRPPFLNFTLCKTNLVRTKEERKKKGRGDGSEVSSESVDWVEWLVESSGSVARPPQPRACSRSVLSGHFTLFFRLPLLTFPLCSFPDHLLPSSSLLPPLSFHDTRRAYRTRCRRSGRSATSSARSRS